MLSFNVNWLAILVSVVVNMVIGAVWYGAYATAWMHGIGKTQEQIQGNQSWRPYGVAMLNSLFMAFVLANVINWVGAPGLWAGILIGAIMWLGFTGLPFAANHAFEGRSLTLWWINAGTYLVGLVLMGAILGAWR